MLGLMVFVILVLSVALILHIKKQKMSYSDNISIIQKNKELLNYDMVFEAYLDFHGVYPKNLESIYTFLEEFPVFKLDFESFIDPFSRTENLLAYHPVYNKKNKKRIGYLIYSAGLDGKIQNQLSESDSLFLNNIELSSLFYNKLEPACRSIMIDSVCSYSALQNLFGKKDYLISV
jgi:hypothetical protein